MGDMLSVNWKAIVLTGLLFLITGCGSTGPHATCPAGGSPKLHFCLTAQEASLNDHVVHVPTLPDALLLKAGVSLTLGPNDHSRITEKAAIASVSSITRDMAPGAKVRSAVFAEIHDAHGLPVKSTAVWLVDVTPPKAQGYVIVVVNASTGAVLYTDTYKG